MSCTSPLTVASTMRPLPASSLGLLHVRFQVGHGGFHHLGRLQHERQLHLAGAEQFADGLHARQQVLVDDGQRRLLGHRLVEVGLQAVALAVDDAPRKPFQQRQLGQLGRRATPSTRPPTRPRTVPSVPAAGRSPRGGGRRPDPALLRAVPRGSGSSAGSCEACTIAESSPASWHSCRNTELSTWRAAGFRPNEMFDSPSVVCTSGCLLLEQPDGLDGLDAVACATPPGRCRW